MKIEAGGRYRWKGRIGRVEPWDEALSPMLWVFISEEPSEIFARFIHIDDLTPITPYEQLVEKVLKDLENK